MFNECKYRFERGGITKLWLSTTAKQVYLKYFYIFQIHIWVECRFNEANKISTKEIESTYTIVRNQTKTF